MAKLYVMNGSLQGRSFDLPGTVVRIGRAPDNDIRIEDNSISRKHLILRRQADQYVVEDVGSTNGTFIKGKRISPGKAFEIEPGLPVVIGKILVSVGKPCSENAVHIPDSEDPSNEFSGTGLFTLDRRRPYTTTRNLELIYKVSNVLMQSLDIDEILEKILDYIFDLLKRIDRGSILLVNHDTGELEQIIGRSKFETKKTDIQYSRTITDQVMETGKPITMSDLSQDPQGEFSDSMLRMQSVMCVPLISRSQTRGVIYVDSVSKPYGFREEDLSLITALSSPAAVAIENALLYLNLEKKIADRTRSLKETEKKLRQSETRFKAIFNNMSSGVMVCKGLDDGEDFRLIDLNRAARSIENIKKHEIGDKRVSEIFPEFKELGLLNVFRRVKETDRPEHHSLTLSQNGKPTGWREYYVYRLPSGEIVAIYDDVTDRKKAEAEQKALQEQLLVSQKLESIGTFAGGTAHNFRNILQAISGNIEYLEMVYGSDSQIGEMSKSIHDSVKKGVDLINNLLHFSKKGGEVQVVPLDLADVIIKTYDIISKVFDKNIRIKLDLAEDLFVDGNHSLLSQVFLNLFTNAKDAMPEGGDLIIEAKRTNDRVVATVSDTGCGMDEETLEKIFDPFFTLKEVGKGTGLGLSTTLGIAEQHGGFISVSSQPGKGTRFEISLPGVKTEVLKAPVPEKKLIFGTGQKVLIVDDERPALEALANLTGGLGYQTISVERPEEALEQYSQCTPDVVLMDRNMPEMDGISCIKQIVKTDPNAKIVIVSGYEESGQDGIDNSIKPLIKGYLTKPCGTEALSKMLSDVLRQ